MSSKLNLKKIIKEELQKILKEWAPNYNSILVHGDLVSHDGDHFEGEGINDSEKVEEDGFKSADLHHKDHFDTIEERYDDFLNNTPGPYKDKMKYPLSNDIDLLSPNMNTDSWSYDDHAKTPLDSEDVEKGLDESIIKEDSLDIPNGKYTGSILGYNVHIDELDKDFKTTSGYKNVSLIPCTVLIIDNRAIVYSKDGITFSDKDIEERWKKKYGKGYNGMMNDPIFKSLKEQSILNEYIRKNGSKWTVYSHSGKSLGSYDTRKAAIQRLKQIEYFKHK